MAATLFLRSMRLQDIQFSKASLTQGVKLFQGARQMATRPRVHARQEKIRRKLENDRNKTDSATLAATTGMSLGSYRRQFTQGKRKTGGRNSSGRITSFHRGGGAKLVLRKIDMKRSTSATGIVEKIDYDPTRSSRVALVRWTDGVKLGPRRKCNTIEEFTPPPELLEPFTTTIRGSFWFSSLPGQRCVYRPTPDLTSANNARGRKLTCVRDVILSALSRKPKGETSSFDLSKSVQIPSFVAIGAKPAFFSLRVKDEVGDKNTFTLSDIQRWKPQSHKLKRKTAISWASIKKS